MLDRAARLALLRRYPRIGNALDVETDHPDYVPAVIPTEGGELQEVLALPPRRVHGLVLAPQTVGTMGDEIQRVEPLPLVLPEEPARHMSTGPSQRTLGDFLDPALRSTLRDSAADLKGLLEDTTQN